ncbi:SH3R2 ligase, partial [Probosciger aterrimus]|nr:SH3R2 ligase [Probosciger aterrimus]
LTPQVPRAKALYTYRGHNPGELRFNKGDIIVLLRQLDENWYLGEMNGISGVFPASSVQVIKHLPLPVPLSRALGSFDTRGRDKTENKESLTLHKVTAAPRAGLGPCVGCRCPTHPASIGAPCWMSPNTTARQLLQTSKSHWSPQFKCTSLRTASPKAKGADSPAFPKVPDSRRKSLRQFSITTALNTLNRMVHSPERQALEISSPVLISSSNPTVATQSSEKAELPYSTPIQVSASYYPAPGSLGHSAAIVTLPHLQHHLSAYMYVRKPRYLVGVVSFSVPSPESYPGPASWELGEPWPGAAQAHQSHRDPCWANPQAPHKPIVCSFSNRKPNLSDSKMPSLYATWTLSTSSLSSQGSAPEHGPRQSRPLKPALLPVPVPSAGRSAAAAGPAPLRRGRGSARKNGSLQRPGQAGTPVHVAGSLRRPLTTVMRPQQIQLYPHLSPAPHSIPTEAGVRTNFSHDASPVLVVRGGESRTPSVCSSVVLDAKDPLAKSEAAPKPPASAPPSILVKPESSRNSADKQVKTVRFQNHSPPPPKRH